METNNVDILQNWNTTLNVDILNVTNLPSENILLTNLKKVV